MRLSEWYPPHLLPNCRDHYLSDSYPTLLHAQIRAKLDRHHSHNIDELQDLLDKKSVGDPRIPVPNLHFHRVTGERSNLCCIPTKTPIGYIQLHTYSHPMFWNKTFKKQQLSVLSLTSYFCPGKETILSSKPTKALNSYFHTSKSHSPSG